MTNDINYLADWAKNIKASALQELLSITASPKITSFALGLPAAEFFPAEELAIVTERVLRQYPRSLQYGPPLQKLKEQVVSLMAYRGVECSEEQVFLTSGGQQGMSLLVRLLLNQGGPVLIEDKIYTGFQQVLEPYQPELYTVSTDMESGIDLDEVESYLAHGLHPAFIYAITDGHNPMSISLSLEKRKRLVELAERYSVPIIEDDAYGFLNYQTESLPPLRAFSQDWVFYIGTFSKILAPAMRVGWLVVPKKLISQLSIVKEANDINMSPLAQQVVSGYLETGQLLDHINILRHEYKLRRNMMLKMIEHFFPENIRYNIPTNGFFIWVELPAGVDTVELLKVAIQEEQLAFLPGQAFTVNKPANTTGIRLNFSNCSEEVIELGMVKLARLIKGFVANILMNKSTKLSPTLVTS